MLEFEVKDMTCGHCVQTITQAINEAAPKATVHIDLDQHRVQVQGADRAQVEETIRQAGYTPVLKA